MAAASGLTVVIDSSAVPVFDKALEYASFGLIPEGAYNNREYLESRVEISQSVRQNLEDVLYDPQTSGPLALAMEESEAEKFISAFGNDARIIARFTKREAKPVII